MISLLGTNLNLYIYSMVLYRLYDIKYQTNIVHVYIPWF